MELFRETLIPSPPPPPLLHCFLCEEDNATAPVYKVCACDQAVHEACFHRLLKVPAHETHCAVCQHPYDVRIRYGRRARWTHSGAKCLSLMISISFTMPIALWTMMGTCHACWSEGNLLLKSEGVIVFAIATVLFFMCVYMCIMNRRASGRWCLVQCPSVPLRRKVRLPAPLEIAQGIA